MLENKENELQELRSKKKYINQTILPIFGLIIALILFNADASFLSKIGAIGIILSASLSGYLWSIEYVKGFPLFPFLCSSYIFSHALSLITEDDKVQSYTSLEHFYMSLNVSLFILTATFFWVYFSRRQKLVSTIWHFPEENMYSFFIFLMVACIIYHVAALAGYLWLFLPNSVVSILRTALPALTSFGLISLSHKLGGDDMSKMQRNIFLILLVILIFTSGAGLYLNIPGVYLLISCIGYLFGSRKLPWRTLLVAFLVISFLYVGKGDTRGKYWGQGAIYPNQYVEIYSYWINSSLEEISSPSDLWASEGSEGLGDRASVSEMLLKVMRESGTIRPYVHGQTYEIIPQLLVPRFLNSNKIRGAEANHILSVHYGIKTYEETFVTAIGWGILQEAYANFGWYGTVGLGIFIGIVYGSVTSWSSGFPPTSFRFLVSTIFLIMALRTEVTMGTFVTVSIQSLFLLQVLKLNFMKRTTLETPVLI